ncbi:Nuclear inhibitor of protein phosphatase [Fasciola hepatica]|uniref:Nuclear inhibitor of protein phosphatase n=1 Tax=Fasciola hepatica TaxID=6192 RepID=A0A4E0RJ80_FASHE|nr:Nuclear inhibitor of protein phosphatase [Fasciola hepatica]
MSQIKPGELLVNNFKIPPWAGKPPPGLHLDVMKDGKLIQKLIIDEKSCYFFGRNKQLCDFAVEHQSCSRVHAVLVWHKFLSRAFLIDLGSVHGTYIGRIRLEGHRPQQVPIDSELHFGASTRIYIIRERPNPLYNGSNAGDGTGVGSDGLNSMGPVNRSLDDSGTDGASLGLLNSHLPQSEVELDNLTEFNTAHNRRIAGIVDVPANNSLGLGERRKRKLHSVHFSDADEVINPEDVDPSVGRFRNLVQETFIPNKRAKGAHEGAFLGVAAPEATENRNQPTNPRIVVNSTPTATSLLPSNSLFGPAYSVATKLGLPLPNLAPDIDSESTEPCLPPTLAMLHAHAHSRPGSLTAALPDGKQLGRLSANDILGTETESGLVEPDFPKRKKYAKEAWPGKRPGFLVGPTV